MKKPNYKPKSCNICGEVFKPVYSNQRYCSEKCRKQHISEVGKKRYYKKYVKKGSNREMVCKVCGNTYIGHYNSRYCIECLKNSKYHIKRYLYNRIDYDGE